VASVHLLGTGAALASPDRTTTMLALEGISSVVAIDCGGDVVQRILLASLDLEAMSALILTHEHPDHVGGFPLFMEKIWLAGRRRPIPVCGPTSALRVARRLFESFDTSGWKGMPAIDWREVSLTENATVWTDAEWDIRAAPGKHSVPVIGIRAEHLPSGRTMAYSADTEPFEPIVRLAKDADLLVHEATGRFPGHSTASDAAEVAERAGARMLVLVHLPPTLNEQDHARAESIFAGTELGRDGASYDF